MDLFHISIHCFSGSKDRTFPTYILFQSFRSKRSCETQLIEFVDDTTKTMSVGKQTDVLIMDFSKAFDKVGHSLLLETRTLRNQRKGQ